MRLIASCWAVNVLMGTLQAMGRTRSATEYDFRTPYMVDMSWLNPDFFHHTVSETGWSFGREVVMWSFLKLNIRGIILKVDGMFKAVVELCRPKVRATTPEIAEWVGDMVG